MLSLITNKRTFAATQSRFHFNSAVILGSQILMANGDGVWLHGGATDNGSDINGMIKSGSTDFGQGNQKRFRFFYFGIETDGDCLCRVFTDGVEVASLTVSPVSSGYLDVRVPISREHQGRYWAWSIENVNGSSLRLHKVEALQVILHRGRGR